MQAVLDMDVRGLFNHDANYPLGRTKSGTMWLRAVKEGVEYVVPELPKARLDVLEAIERGDVDGSSWSFTIAAGGDEWSREEGKKPHRRILRFERVFDVGPVAFPAYEGLATVSQRALDSAQGSAPLRPRRTMSTAEARRQMRELEAKSRAIPDEPRKRSTVRRLDRRTAYHEAGHAFSRCG